MILSGERIRKLNLISENMDEKSIQPNSYDLSASDESQVILEPGECRLISTREKVKLPNGICGKTVSKSSWARLGVSIGDIAGWIDAGFEGNITLLAVNHSKHSVAITGRIAQIVFMESEPAERVYSGHYQGSRGVVGSVLDVRI